jgi:hypothetical protein
MKDGRKVVKLRWMRFCNFFELYEKKGDVRRMIYVIGNARLVYVGCVGCVDGERGLRRRYDKPYVERAKSIFGRRTPSQQPAYAAEFVSPQEPSGSTMRNAERIVQEECEKACPRREIMFSVRGTTTKMTLKSYGELPDFMNANIVAP